MSDKLAKPPASAIDREEYLDRDKERFRPGASAGAPRGLMDHDPYAIVERPNPNGRAMVEAILTWDGDWSKLSPNEPEPFTIPSGSKLIDTRGIPFFETYQDAVFEGGAGNVIVGALAVRPGSKGNVDCHVLYGVQGYPYGHVRADNPFPGMGGADERDGVLVVGNGPPRPKLEAILDGRGEEHGEARLGDVLYAQRVAMTAEALQLVIKVVDAGLEEELPDPWPDLLFDLRRTGFAEGVVTLETIVRSEGKVTILLRSHDRKLGLVFRGETLIGAMVDDIERRLEG